MNDPEPQKEIEFEIERLVRGHLEREAERIDPRPLFGRIQGSLSGRPAPRVPLLSRRPSARVLWKWAGVAAAAASVFLGLALLLHDRTALAKGKSVVFEARKAHLLPIDRCYLVEVRRESSLVAELSPTTPQVRLTRLWTRGDRFWVESVRPEQRWAWGRDGANRFWMAFGRHTAVRMEPDEVPFWLNLYCELHSLNVEQLLGDVLNRFELTRETTSSSSDTQPSTIRVHATARDTRRQYPSIKTADLEIDAETRVVRRMIVRRVLNGQPFATVTYTLAETDALDPNDYRLEGHLTEPSEIYSRDHEPQRRKELLTRWFGPRSGSWFRTLEPVK
jgi:hypothetical protein